MPDSATRNFFINGETLVRVRGAVGGPLASVTELGLAEGPIGISMTFHHADIKVDAWGGTEGPPPEVQFMGAEATVNMDLVHVDRNVLDYCIAAAMGRTVIGTLPSAGTRMGSLTNGLRFQSLWKYLAVYLSSPDAGKPWAFLSCYLATPPLELSCGVRRSIFRLNWRVIPYRRDPWNSGSGASGTFLWAHVEPGNDTYYTA